MPELPEVESAARRLRAAVVGKAIVRMDVLHRSLIRRLSPSTLRSLVGVYIVAVERRGKHQLLRLDDGRVLHAHFRMTGDWHIDLAGAPLPAFARATIILSDGTRVVLEDARALSTLDLHSASDPLVLDIGPEADDLSLTSQTLGETLAKRRGPIKPALLDQHVLAGLGNIYAAESLWYARISPVAPASRLGERELKRLIAAIRRVLARAAARNERYRSATGETTARGKNAEERFRVYDREGSACRRCGTAIARMVQAGRSTYFCPGCQTDG